MLNIRKLVPYDDANVPNTRTSLRHYAVLKHEIYILFAVVADILCLPLNIILLSLFFGLYFYHPLFYITAHNYSTK